jgi:hypothetical protein
MGGAPMGGAPMGGAPMGGAPMGGAPMGGAPMGGAPMGAAGMPKPHRQGMGLFAKLKIAGVVVVGLAIAAGGGWFALHPTTYVDNAGKKTLNVYVDGKKVATLEAGDHESLSLMTGSHEFGYSPKGKKKPTETVKGDVGMFKSHLYNPGKTACYWLVVDRYGRTSGSGPSGPLKIKEFYQFSKVDNWFSENPEVVRLKKKQKGKTKVALQRAKMCMQFRDCALKVRQSLVKCQSKALDADDEAAFDACGDKAQSSCKSGGGDDNKKASSKSGKSDKKSKKK